MKRSIDTITELESTFCKKLKLNNVFDINDCHISISTLELGMGSNLFIEKTAARYDEYTHQKMFQIKDLQTLLQEFLDIYNNKQVRFSFASEQQMQLIKLIYNIDSFIINKVSPNES